MSRVIIVDGPNNCGKSTICQDIIREGERHGQIWKLVKCSQPKDNDAHGEYNRIAEEIYKDDTGTNYIIDRFHLGEMVYPKIKMRVSNFGGARFETLEEKLKSFFDVRLVVCMTDPEHAKEMNELNKEEFIKPEEVEKEFSLFLEAFQRSRLKKLLFDWRKPNMRIALFKHVFDREELDD